ncbi:DMT family transporter [Frigidibacter sp. MR17.24]|uniref:DMT family transporter n=1 Tax=Frigidibacter sp. MR17.24 TaxID=3127345 RepID=UPI003012D74E
MTTQTLSRERPYLAALWMAGAIFGFSAMAMSARGVSEGMTTFGILFWRSVVGILIVGGVAVALGRGNELRLRAPGLQVLRNGVHLAGQGAWLKALGLIPLAQLFAVEFSYPIIVALLAPLVLGERLGAVKLGTAMLGFCGILLVARPFGGAGISPGILWALGAALGFAGSAIATKRLTRQVTVISVLFWMSVLQAVMALALVVAAGHPVWPAPRDWLMLPLVSIFGLVAHLSLTTALSLAPASVVTPMDFLRLPLIAVVGALFYAEPFDPMVILGGAVIFAANWVNLLVDGRRRRAAAPPDAQLPGRA